MQEIYEELKKRSIEIRDVGSAGSVLGWDQQVNMPPGGAEARGRQLATLGKIAHEMLVDRRMGELLESLAPYEGEMGHDSDEASLIRQMRRLYEKAVKVPSEFTVRFSRAESECFDVWIRARPANDFPMVRPSLENILGLCSEYADFFPGHQHSLDPLLDSHEHGMCVSDVRPIFAELRKALVPMVDAITSQEPADDSFLRQHFEPKRQLEFGDAIIRAYGYDFNRGRQDMAPHPFTTSFALGDVRITTRVQENFLGSALFGTLHEAGHAMYEQGVSPTLDGTPLRGGTTIGVHESQSRLWENVVGRSRGFWNHNYPALQRLFPEQLGQVRLDTFYSGINKVQKSLIRVEADEVTYNLHVMMRFDFECQLMENKLSIAELPQAWNDRMESDVGIRPSNDTNGVLQDIHWYNGIVGYFQGYTLGNIMSAQFYDAAVKAHPEIPDDIAQGKYEKLHGWMKENIYRHGAKFTAAEILERATGNGLDIGPYIKYLKSKYGELYQL